MTAHVLIVDDDYALGQMLAMHFEDGGYRVSTAETCAAALSAIRGDTPDIVLLDQQLPDGTGLDLLGTLREALPDTPVIMMTGAHDLELAIAAIKDGARDFVHKPIKTEELEHAVGQALQHVQLARKVAALESAPEPTPIRGGLIGKSDAMLKVSKEIALTAASDASVLISGESGTGKEVVARAIHTHSNREGPFVAVNSAAIVDTLLESELFGHEKGAFTGAVTRKAGKFELARDGTLFLDEIGELALPLQAKLLRVLQEQSFERVGGNQVLTTNARIITATNRDLELEVAEKRFREDLLYRLNVIRIELPPLRERKEDIPLLTQALLERISQTLHKAPLRMTPSAMERMMAYAWPGNVRELENVLTQAMVRGRDGLLAPDLLAIPDEAATAAPVTIGDSADERLLSLDEVEATHIQRVLYHTRGHKGKSCEILGISRPALDRKIVKYDLRVPKDRA
jgi:two-component system response regulator AtoC